MPTPEEIENLARKLRRKARIRSLPDSVGPLEAAQFSVEAEDAEWREFEAEARRQLGG